MHRLLASPRRRRENRHSQRAGQQRSRETAGSQSLVRERRNALSAMLYLKP